MKIAFTFNVKPADAAAGPADRYAEWEDEVTIAAVEARPVPRRRRGPGRSRRTICPSGCARRAPTSSSTSPKASRGPNREAHVPALCEFWSTPYTGSDSLTMSLCLDKGRTKEILGHHGILTAPFTVVGGPEDLDGFAAWPAIVKPVHEGSSMGITRSSYCPSPEEARREIAERGPPLPPARHRRGLSRRPRVHLRDPGQRGGGARAADHRGRLRGPARGRAADLLVRGEVDLGQAGGAARHLPLPGARSTAPSPPRSSGRRSPPIASCAAATGRGSTSAATRAACPTSSR